MGVALFAVASVSAYLLSGIGDVELGAVAPYFIVAIALQLVPFLVRPTPDPFEPASHSAVMTLLTIVPTFTSFLASDSVNIALLPHVSGRARIDLLQSVLIAYSVGSIAYFIGYYQGIGKRLTGIFPDVAGGTWKRSRVILVCAVCFLVFVPAYAFFQARVGTAIGNVTDLSAGKNVMHDDTSNKTWIARAVGIGFMPPLVLLAMAFPKLTWRRGIATFGLLFVVGFLATRLGSRGTAVFCLIHALMVVHYLWRRIPMSVLAPVAFVVLVLINLLGQYRNVDAQAPQGPQANFNVQQTLVEHDEDRMRVAATAVVFHYFPDQKDHLMGESWGPALTLFIPRWLWPEKHLMFLWRDSNMILMITGAPVPVGFLALLYANFSWVGIVLGMAVWGAYQRGMYEWLLRNSKDRSVVLLYSALVVYFGPTMLQLSATVGFVVPIWAVLRYIRLKPRVTKKGALPPRPGDKAPETPLLPAPSAAAAE